MRNAARGTGNGARESFPCLAALALNQASEPLGSFRTPFAVSRAPSFEPRAPRSEPVQP